MRDSKSTKRALAASVGCVALCSAMLVGTTFAWFTDTATTNVNSIQAGTLDVALEYYDNGDWQSADGMTLAFKKAADAGEEYVIWEPGCTYELPQIRVVNKGSLALKYRIEIIGLDGDDELNDVLDWTINDKEFDTTDYSLAAGAQSDALTIKAHMQETANNDYQGKSLSGVKISVTATQDTVEYDSYNNTYDARAAYAVPDTAAPVSSAEDLTTAVKNGEDVVLTEEIEMPANLQVTSDVTIYGSGTGKLVAGEATDRVINVVSNDKPVTITLVGLDIESPEDKGNDHDRAISLYGNSDVSLVMDNCSVTANHYALNVAQSNAKVNVTVRNSSITGYAAFQIQSPNTTAVFENCTLTGINQWQSGNGYSVINLYQNAANSNVTFKNCSITAEKDDSAWEVFLIEDGENSVVNFDGCRFFVTENNETKEMTDLNDIYYGTAGPEASLPDVGGIIQYDGQLYIDGVEIE